MTVRQKMKKVTPNPMWKLGSNGYWWWHNRGRHLLAKWLERRWAQSANRLRQLENTRTNQRCFIIGNGPSLRRTDLSRLAGEFTFGLNRIYLLFPELGFTTSCLVMVNDLVIEQCAADLQSLSLPRFITWRGRYWLKPDPGLVYLDTDFTGPEDFCPKLTGRIFEGFTVTYVALQLAFHMGFKEAILVGVDHNYVTQGAANQEVISLGDDPNHFRPAILGEASGGSCPTWLARKGPIPWPVKPTLRLAGRSWMLPSRES